tara:strand:+ start:167 stop:529 length:363 start_codon:yes stop_codon:yes gene_type:complete
MYKFITNSNLSLEDKNWDSVESPIAFDIPSFLHIFSGFLGYIILHKCLKISILKSFILFNIVHLLYELKDFYLAYIKVYKNKRTTRKESFFFHANNSYMNSIVDLICGCIGFLIAFIIFK